VLVARIDAGCVADLLEFNLTFKDLLKHVMPPGVLVRLKTSWSLVTGKYTGTILDAYVRRGPSPQNALDIFKGEWSSKLPSPYDSATSGRAELFDDARITWAGSRLGGFDGTSVLELGPLEAGHSYMLEKMGAKDVLAVEANTRAYLKCLIVKEVLGLSRVRFLLGDFIEYLRHANERFDVCLASGVLYHMQDPAGLIRLVSMVSDGVVLWTHYYDDKVIKATPALSHKFSGPVKSDCGGFGHSLYRHEYKSALGWSGFCGGSGTFSNWMTRDDILACLGYFGFEHISVGFEQPGHANGPCFCVVGSRTPLRPEDAGGTPAG
jgi:Protein of unknown function (DUF1698)